MRPKEIDDTTKTDFSGADKDKQFMTILEFSASKAFLMGIAMGLLHWFSGAQSSLIQRMSYPFGLSLFFYAFKQALLHLSNDSKLKRFIVMHSTIIFLFGFSVGVTESTIFQSPNSYSLSHT